MPTLQKAERLERVLHADSRAIMSWRQPAYVQARSALGLVSNADYVVYCTRNTRSITGLAAIRVGEKNIQLLHLAGRDYGNHAGTMLIEAIQRDYPEMQIRTVAETAAESYYEHLGWRKVGNEYWSR